jgi:hypothetical protein
LLFRHAGEVIGFTDGWLMVAIVSKLRTSKQGGGTLIELISSQVIDNLAEAKGPRAPTLESTGATIT